jgi:hypothetical protein
MFIKNKIKYNFKNTQNNKITTYCVHRNNVTGKSVIIDEVNNN